MKLAVLNPGGNDPEQHFPDLAGAPAAAAHPPVNYHAYAACTGGAFFRKDAAIPSDIRAVLVLLRRDLKACRQAVIDLRREGKIVAISFKESGAFQVAELLAKPARLKLFREICQRAHFAVSSTEDLTPFYRAAGARQVEFIPTPYPIEDKRWNFSREPGQRRGIFVGTREFDTPSRNHLSALLSIRPLAEGMAAPVTVFNIDGWKGRRMLAQLNYPEGLLRVIEGRLPYPKYLEAMAQHALVFQLDMSAVPGQVAGDALLCRLPCVGGNGAVERAVFPELCGHGRTPEQLFDLTARLLDHPHDCVTAVERALELARMELSFTVGARRLKEAFRPFLS